MVTEVVITPVVSFYSLYSNASQFMASEQPYRDEVSGASKEFSAKS